jgi:drug/metabolite transporter (DMT)-like permease
VLLSAACAGTANVLQAREARRFSAAPGLRPDLLVRLISQAGYRAALALIGVGMLLALYALRVLPVFLVQAGRAASLGVTAVLAVWMLGTRPRRSELVAVVAVAAGLVALAVSTGPQAARVVVDAPTFGLIGLVALVGLLAAWLSRIGSTRGAGTALAVLAGLCYAILALGGRLLRELSPASVVTDPTAWAMALAGGLGLLLSAMALQRAGVVAVTAAVVGTETVVAALLGVLLCGDRPNTGGTASAICGFLLVTGGALALARFGGHMDSSPADPTRDSS